MLSDLFLSCILIDLLYLAENVRTFHHQSPGQKLASYINEVSASHLRIGELYKLQTYKRITSYHSFMCLNKSTNKFSTASIVCTTHINTYITGKIAFVNSSRAYWLGPVVSSGTLDEHPSIFGRTLPRGKAKKTVSNLSKMFEGCPSGCWR